MKKKFFAALAAVVIGSGLFTGCQKERPYCWYEVGASFYDLPTDPNGEFLTPQEAEELPAAQRDKYFVANEVASWLINNSYIRTTTSGAGPLIIEGEDITYNDLQALNYYEGCVTRLDEVDLDQAIEEAQQGGTDRLTITTSGTVTFSYALTRTSTLPEGTSTSKMYTVHSSPVGSSDNTDSSTAE